MTIFKNACIDKLDDIVNKYNNAYHCTIKIKPVDVKSHTYFNSNKKINDEDPKFKTGNFVKISKCTFLQKAMLEIRLKVFYD